MTYNLGECSSSYADIHPLSGRINGYIKITPVILIVRIQVGEFIVQKTSLHSRLTVVEAGWAKQPTAI